MANSARQPARSTKTVGKKNKKNKTPLPYVYLESLSVAFQQAPNHAHYEARPRVGDVARPAPVILCELSTFDNLFHRLEK